MIVHVVLPYFLHCNLITEVLYHLRLPIQQLWSMMAPLTADSMHHSYVSLLSVQQNTMPNRAS